MARTEAPTTTTSNRRTISSGRLDHLFDSYDRLMALDGEAAPIDRLWTALEFFASGPGEPQGPDRHYHIAIFQLQALAARDPKLRDRFTRNFHYVVDLTAAIVEDGLRVGDAGRASLNSNSLSW